MKKEDFFEVLGELDDDIVKGAETPMKKKMNCKAWGTMAACIAVVAVLSVGLFQSGLFGNRTDIATLDNGDKIVFVKSDTIGGSSLAIDVDKKQLTEEEARSLFADLPVVAYAIYRSSNLDAGSAQNLIGFEGKIGNVKMIVSTSDFQLLDTVIVGKEESTEINGTNITAGYFVTDPNSKGEQNAIYYATHELGSCKMYLENSGTKDNSEATKNQLVEVVQKLIENGELDLTSFVDHEIGTSVDGNPDGYDLLPNSQTSDGEISEQDKKN